MKYAIAFIAATLAMPASANDEYQKKIDQTCQVIGELAQSALAARYAGASLSDALAIADRNGKGFIREYFRRITIAAWQEPEYYGQEAKERAKREFRNTWELSCHTDLPEGIARELGQ